MPRMMSFSMTTPQFLDGTKDVTRRLGWWGLRPGTILMAVEKGMGLRKGQKVRRLGLIEVVSARGERLDAMTGKECAREGFPEMTPAQFVRMFCRANRCDFATMVNRIEFRRLADERSAPGVRPSL